MKSPVFFTVGAMSSGSTSKAYCPSSHPRSETERWWPHCSEHPGSKASGGARAGGAPPNSDLMERPLGRGEWRWELAEQAGGTGLGPDNPRSKQPVSGVS